MDLFGLLGLDSLVPCFSSYDQKPLGLDNGYMVKISGDETHRTLAMEFLADDPGEHNLARCC